MNLLTYSEIVTYLVESKPAERDSVRGAILRRRQGADWLVSFCFLDATGTLCLDERGRELGKQVQAGSFDDELNDLFGDEDLLVVE